MDRETAGLIMERDPDDLTHEVLRLQAIIAEQSVIISSQSSTIQKQSDELSAKEAAITGQDGTIAAQREEIEGLRQRVAELVELGRMRRAERYKPSTESMDQFFPELEELFRDDEGDKAGETEPRPARARKERKRRRPLSARAGSDVCDIDHVSFNLEVPRKYHWKSPKLSSGWCLEERRTLKSLPGPQERDQRRSEGCSRWRRLKRYVTFIAGAAA